MTAVILLLSLLGAMACHEVTEYSEQGEYTVHKIALSDFTLQSSLGGFDGGRSLCSIGNSEFLVASNRGVLYRVSSPDMTPEGIYSLGSPFSSGYRSMVQVSAGSVYLVGAFGNVLEFNLTTNTMADEFSAGPSPTCISRSADGGSLFVIDAQDAALREFDTLDNEFVGDVTLSTAASTIIPWASEPVELQLAISNTEPVAYPIWVEYMYPSSMDLPSVAVDVAAFQDTTILCTVHGGVSSPMAMLSAGFPLVEASMTIPLSGQPQCAAADQAHHRFYVASLLDGPVTRIYEIDGLFWDIERTMEVPGYPWDITTHANGDYLLVLTSS